MNECYLFVRRELPLHFNTIAKRRIRFLVVVSSVREKSTAVSTDTVTNRALFNDTTGVYSFSVF